MKKSLLAILIFIILHATDTLACEICGCGNSNFQIGILPNFNKGFMGFRYSASRFSSTVQDDASEFSRDSYSAMEIWGGYNIRRLQIMTFVPYLMNRKESDDGVTTHRGIGDVILLASYPVITNTWLSENEKTTLRNQLFLGGGVKLPSGRDLVDTEDPDFNIGDFNSQPGTGSTDLMIALTHNLAWNDNGVVTNLAYRINGSSPKDYQFGNRVYLSSAFYRVFNMTKIKIRPHAGIDYQHNAINTFQGTSVEDSDGYILSATAGVNVVHGRAGLNAMAFFPTVQNFYDGQTTQKARFSVGVTYSL